MKHFALKPSLKVLSFGYFHAGYRFDLKLSQDDYVISHMNALIWVAELEYGSMIFSKPSNKFNTFILYSISIYPCPELVSKGMT